MMPMTLPALPAKAGQKTTFGQLVGSSLALVAARLTREARRPVLLVTADTPSALRLEQELGFLLADQDCPVLLFPDWETLPYDSFSPHQTSSPSASRPSTSCRRCATACSSCPSPP